VTLADRTIAALRTNHDELAHLVSGLASDQLTGPSGADEWSLAQVLSHLGSGAEITLAGLRAAQAGDDAPGSDFNQSVWDRWDAMTPADQAAGFVETDNALVEAYEALSADERDDVQIGLGFLPTPLSIAGAAGLRFNEAALHGWDVRAGLDTSAALSSEAAQLLAEHFSGDIGFLLGWVGKADQIDARTVVDVHGFGLVVDDGVSLNPSAEAATATFDGPLEAALRLIGGRLKPAFTPPGVTVTGNVTLDDLRRVFPGF
jgi:uncharacterized protein (TIGR03083 family)